MHSVNLDLLGAISRHTPDGHPRDPHAVHWAEHLAVLKAARRDRWLARLRRWTFIRVLSPTARTQLSPAPHG